MHLSAGLALHSWGNLDAGSAKICLPRFHGGDGACAVADHRTQQRCIITSASHDRCQALYSLCRNETCYARTPTPTAFDLAPHSLPHFHTIYDTQAIPSQSHYDRLTATSGSSLILCCACRSRYDRERCRRLRGDGANSLASGNLHRPVQVRES